MSFVNLTQHSMILLGWNLIRKALSDHVYSSSTQAVCRQLQPESSFIDAQSLLHETIEMVSLIQSGESFPLTSFYDLSPILEDMIQSGIMEGAAALKILRLLRMAKNIPNFLKPKEGLTRIKEHASQLEPLTGFLKELERCIDEEGEIKDNASPELKLAIRSVQTLKSDLEKKLEKLISNPSVQEALQDHYYTEREGRLVLPLKSEHRSKVEGIVHDTSASGATLFMEPSSIVSMNNQLKINRIKVDQEKIKILRQLAEKAIEHKQPLLSNFEILIQLDLIHAKACLAKALNAVEFEFQAQGPVNLKQARNPEMVLDGQDVVPNHIQWDQSTHVIIISGPNTGGKTVTLKTMGLMALMARAGLLLPVAEGSKMSFFPEVYADIGDDQNIHRHLSTFSAHLEKIIGVLNHASPGSLVLLDELGIATDPIQGAALAEAILLDMKQKGLMTFVSTHYLSLKTLAQVQDGFLNACMEFDGHSHSPTYKLIFGVPGNSAALEIAKRIGLDPKIIHQAESIYSNNDTRAEELLNTLHKQKLEMEKEMEQLQRQTDEIHRLKQEQESLMQSLRNQELTFRKEKSRRLQKEVRESRNQIHSMIKEIKGNKTPQKMREVDRKLGSLKQQLAATETLDLKDWDIPPDQLEKGDRVIVDSYGARGKLLEIPDGKKKVRVQLGTMKMTVELKRLRGNSGMRNKRTPQSIPEPMKILIHTETHSKTRDSCNLKGLRVEEAKSILEAFIDQALVNKVNRVKIIHGHGMGKIKRFVRDYLESCRIGKTVAAGSREEGGDAVTIVEF